MVARYDASYADGCQLELVPPNTKLSLHLETGAAQYGLIIGDPDDSAYAVLGTWEQLRAFVQRVSLVVDGGC